jgi:hypothetical protein
MVHGAWYMVHALSYLGTPVSEESDEEYSAYFAVSGRHWHVQHCARNDGHNGGKFDAETALEVDSSDLTADGTDDAMAV